MIASNHYELERRTRELHALTEIAKTLSVPLDLPPLLGAVMGKLANVLEPAEAGLVMLWDESSGVFRPVAAFGYDLSQMSEVGLRAGEGVTGKVYDEGKASLLNSSDKIAEAIRLISPIKLWEEVGKVAGLPGQDVKARLELVVDRRNKIPHEADMDPTNPGFRWPIDEAMASNALDFIDSVAEAIFNVAA